MMTYPQPYQTPELQDFYSWLESAKVDGVTNLLPATASAPGRLVRSDSSPITGSPTAIEPPSASPQSPVPDPPVPASDMPLSQFVPCPKISEYLTFARVRRILRVFWDRDLPVHEGTVLRKYSKVFCILLVIREGPFIDHFVRHEALGDDKLPLESKPVYFPSVPGKDLWVEFFKAQWMFCAPVLHYDEINRQFGRNVVLPIILKEDLAQGATATTYRVVLHPAYNSLDPIGNTERASRFADTFVLKTYCTRDADAHHNSEVTAYRRLRSGGNGPPGLIGFYGSFIHNGTYSILLEFADRGTLEAYFQAVAPPSTREDILVFWRSIFSLIGALHSIHNVRLSESGDLEDEFRGWHQDVKPENILIISGNHKSDYGCQFKLADLGLAHFQITRVQRKGKTTLSQHAEPSDDDAYGTRTYGAPECYRFDDFIGTSNIAVDQSVDIWSLGCVYSEAAVWLLQGKEGLERYREARKLETRQKGVKDSGCFHDGAVALECIIEEHFRALESQRACDAITESVLDMVQDMLGSTIRRGTAKQLWERSQGLLTKADKVAQRAQSQRKGSDKSSQPRTPPTSSTPSLASTTKRYQSAVFQLPNEHIRTQTQAMGLSTGIPQSQSPRRMTSVDDVKTPMQAIFEGGPSTMLSTDQTSISSPTLMDGVSHLSISSQAEEPPRATMSSERPRIASRIELPELTVQKTLHWMRKKKSNTAWSQLKALAKGKETQDADAALPHATLLQQLKHRDHVFLVDDSSSMAEHWDNVKELLQVLAYMVKKFDTNGIDLFFTRHKDRYNSDRSTELAGILDNLDDQLNGPSNMEESLEKILQEHVGNLQDQINSKGFRSGQRKPSRPMSLYVLTDGLWHKRCQAGNPIAKFVGHLESYGIVFDPGKPTGIQFISFGSDPDSIAHLRYLDDGLGLERDMVDTEPSDGNVCKMLLGAVNKRFDAANSVRSP